MRSYKYVITDGWLSEPWKRNLRDGQANSQRLPGVPDLNQELASHVHLWGEHPRMDWEGLCHSRRYLGEDEPNFRCQILLLACLWRAGDSKIESGRIRRHNPFAAQDDLELKLRHATELLEKEVEKRDVVKALDVMRRGRTRVHGIGLETATTFLRFWTLEKTRDVPIFYKATENLLIELGVIPALLAEEKKRLSDANRYERYWDALEVLKHRRYGSAELAWFLSQVSAEEILNVEPYNYLSDFFAD